MSEKPPETSKRTTKGRKNKKEWAALRSPLFPFPVPAIQCGARQADIVARYTTESRVLGNR